MRFLLARASGLIDQRVCSSSLLAQGRRTGSRSLQRVDPAKGAPGPEVLPEAGCRVLLADYRIPGGIPETPPSGRQIEAGGGKSIRPTRNPSSAGAPVLGPVQGGKEGRKIYFPFPSSRLSSPPRPLPLAPHAVRRIFLRPPAPNVMPLSGIPIPKCPRR